MYGLEHPLGDAPGSYAEEYLGAEKQIDTGPLWFVGVLLILSLAYAALVGARRTPRSRRAREAPGVRQLVAIAAAVAPSSFLIRLAYPYGSESGPTDLNLWEWPACLAAFGLGIASFRHGWLARVPDPLHGHCRRVTFASAASMAVLLLVVGALDVVEQAMGGWHWASAAFAVVDATLTIFGSVWLLVTRLSIVRRVI